MSQTLLSLSASAGRFVSGCKSGVEIAREFNLQNGSALWVPVQSYLKLEARKNRKLAKLYSEQQRLIAELAQSHELVAKLVYGKGELADEVRVLRLQLDAYIVHFETLRFLGLDYYPCCRKWDTKEHTRTCRALVVVEEVPA